MTRRQWLEWMTIKSELNRADEILAMYQFDPLDKQRRKSLKKKHDQLAPLFARLELA